MIKKNKLNFSVVFLSSDKKYTRKERRIKDVALCTTIKIISVCVCVGECVDVAELWVGLQKFQEEMICLVFFSSNFF